MEKNRPFLLGVGSGVFSSMKSFFFFPFRIRTTSFFGKFSKRLYFELKLKKFLVFNQGFSSNLFPPIRVDPSLF